MASNTKANPIRWVWNQAKQVYRRMRGERVEQVTKPTPITRDRYLAQEQGQGLAQSLTDRLFGGEISLQRWQLDFRRDLKDIYRNEYLAARGGINNMTQADWGRLGGILRRQYEFMNRFYDDLAAGRVSKDQARARAEMYFKSARQSFERGQRAALGMPDLPAYPGDGTTQCLSNCQCSWEVQETEDAWLATWTLGAAEHCPDCVQRSNDWAPLRLPK